MGQLVGKVELALGLKGQLAFGEAEGGECGPGEVSYRLLWQGDHFMLYVQSVWSVFTCPSMSSNCLSIPFSEPWRLNLENVQTPVQFSQQEAQAGVQRMEEKETGYLSPPLP